MSSKAQNILQVNNSNCIYYHEINADIKNEEYVKTHSGNSKFITEIHHIHPSRAEIIKEWTLVYLN